MSNRFNRVTLILLIISSRASIGFAEDSATENVATDETLTTLIENLDEFSYKNGSQTTTPAAAATLLATTTSIPTATELDTTTGPVVSSTNELMNKVRPSLSVALIS